MEPPVIVIATGNAGKAAEIAEILSERDGGASGAKVLTLKEAIGYMPEIDENGGTLKDNARIKALAARNALNGHSPDGFGKAIVIADDSGLFVDCLGGRPGVHSARYGGDLQKTQYEPPEPSRQMELLLAEIASTGVVRRSASFRCVMAINYPDCSLDYAEGACYGEIAHFPKGGGGFGYDPVFYLPELGRTMAELAAAEKNSISHRGIAVRRMADIIDKHYRDRNGV